MPICVNYFNLLQREIFFGITGVKIYSLIRNYIMYGSLPYHLTGIIYTCGHTYLPNDLLFPWKWRSFAGKLFGSWIILYIPYDTLIKRTGEERWTGINYF